MENQNQVGFGWLWAPSGGGNGIVFCNPEHQAVTGVTTVPAPIMTVTVDSNRVSKLVAESNVQETLQQTMVPAPVSFEVVPASLSKQSSQNVHPPHQLPTIPVPVTSVPNSVSIAASLATSAMLPKSSANGVAGSKRGGFGGSKSKHVGSKTAALDEDELARKREINKLRERRRREQMTPKERAKARKKNRLRARKRRRNMTPEEREAEKERNRERARQRRIQKLQQEGQQH